MSGEARSATGALEGYEIFIKYLPATATEASLGTFFAEVGPIVGEPRLLKSGDGKCKGVGWITFATREAMQAAVDWNGCSFGGRHLQISAAKAMHTGFRPSLQAAGTHTPAMLAECVKHLVDFDKSGIVIDATFGRGGHSRGMLSAMGSTASLHVFDMDIEAIKVANELKTADKRVSVHHAPFSSMGTVLGGKSGALAKASGNGGGANCKNVGISAALFDLGISSPQFDEAHRGFRPEADGPLDLRFDQSKGETAWQFLQHVERSELIRILKEYGETADEAAARRIADAICISRDQGLLPRRTKEFAALVARAKGVEYQSMHPAKLTFQALRIHLNDEFGELRKGLQAAFELLKPGGRLGIITWKHSECALVMDFFREFEEARKESPQMAWYAAQDGAAPLESGWALRMEGTLRPTERETASNSRVRSAVLHVMSKQRATRATELDHKLYAHLGWRDDAAACGRGLGSETAKVHAQGSNEAVQGAKGNGRAGTGKSGKKMKKVKKDKGMLEKGGNGGSNEKAGKNAELGHKRALENNGCVSNSASKNLKRKKKKKN
mmetsp:Transcript_21770/g.45981  ORF Transcript_21770/g.45981 Transcript_21770/m.45981 type:complete len:556 (-) Transcript_21770:297-1964(-)